MTGVPVIGSPVFSLLTNHTTHSSQFTLTCPSSSFPPLSTTWFRSGQQLMPDGVQFQTSQVLVDASTSHYDNVLRVSGNLAGDYRCEVGNNNGTASASITVRGESKDSLTAVELAVHTISESCDGYAHNSMKESQPSSYVRLPSPESCLVAEVGYWAGWVVQ